MTPKKPISAVKSQIKSPTVTSVKNVFIPKLYNKKIKSKQSYQHARQNRKT